MAVGLVPRNVNTPRAMRTPAPNIHRRMLIHCALALSTASSLTAQINEPAEIAMIGSEPCVQADPSRPWDHFDLVDRQLHPTSDMDHALQRAVRLQADGRYHVRVTTVYGTVKMTGSYLDAGLTLPDGDFTFHYDDGSLESRGMYVMGGKHGTWERFAWGGRRLADRIYVQLSPEERQAIIDGSTEVCTARAE